MSKLKYGIYFSYPSVSGLYGEDNIYSINFLKLAALQQEFKLVIACPSWSQDRIKTILRSHLINTNNFEFISPNKKPSVYLISNGIKNVLYGAPINWLRKIKKGIEQKFKTNLIGTKWASSRNWLEFFLLGLIFIPLGIIMASFLFFIRFGKSVINQFKFIQKRLMHLHRLLEKALYLRLIPGETGRMNKLVNARKDISLWLIPSSSWIDSNDLKQKTTVFMDADLYNCYPLHFIDNAAVEAERIRQSQTLIANTKHIITHTQKMTETIEQNFFGKHIHLIPPLMPGLKQFAEGPESIHEASNKMIYRKLMRSFYFKNIFDPSYWVFVENLDCFLHVSNKQNNLLGVLKAYKRLFDTHLITTKLIIVQPRAKCQASFDFVSNNNLHQHVIWFEVLSSDELAACYVLSRFVINASFEFDDVRCEFLQSLAFDTPILLSKTKDSKQLLEEKEVFSCSLFDAYDTDDIYHKIHSALGEEDTLLAKQKKIADKLPVRTMQEVLENYKEAFKKNSAFPAQDECVHDHFI